VPATYLEPAFGCFPRSRFERGAGDNLQTGTAATDNQHTVGAALFAEGRHRPGFSLHEYSASDPHADRSGAARAVWPATHHAALASEGAMIPADLRERLLFVLHRGLVEIRLLAQAGKVDQMRDLADILEVMPSWLSNGSKDNPSAASIKAELQRYEQRYPEAFKYSDFVDKYDVPPF